MVYTYQVHREAYHPGIPTRYIGRHTTRVYTSLIQTVRNVSEMTDYSCPECEKVPCFNVAFHHRRSPPVSFLGTIRSVKPISGTVRESTPGRRRSSLRNIDHHPLIPGCRPRVGHILHILTQRWTDSTRLIDQPSS